MKSVLYYVAVVVSLCSAKNTGGGGLCKKNVCFGDSLCVTSFSATGWTCECLPGWEAHYCEEKSDCDRQRTKAISIIANLTRSDFRSSNIIDNDLMRSPLMSKMNSASAWVADSTPIIAVIANSINLLFGRHNEETIPWIQAELDMIRQVERVVTKGSPTDPYWINSYKIAHSLDDVIWFMVYDVYTGNEIVFTGNIDQNTTVSNHVPGNRETLFVRLYAITYHQQVALRWEIFARNDPEPVADDIAQADDN